MQFVLASAVGGSNLPFCLGFAFKSGDIPGGNAVLADIVGDSVTLQGTVKNRWPDGSAKFATLAGRATLAAGVPLVVRLAAGSGTLSGANLGLVDLRLANLACVIDANGIGAANWSGSDWDAPFVEWVVGPRMSSWIYRKPVGADPHLVAWLEVRLYLGGSVEVLPWIENGYLRVAGPTNKNTTYTFTMGGTSRFSGVIDLKHHQRTPLLSGVALSHWWPVDPGVVPLQDSAYLQATELVPSYRATVPASAPAIAALPKTYTPLQAGSLAYSSDDMSSPGYQAPIGLLPEHDVLHLVADASARITTFAAVVRNGYSAGRYALHYRDETTNRPPAFSAYPTLVVGGGSIKDTGASTTNTVTPRTTGTAPPLWDTAHSPSIGYMAYLLTGRFYFLEQVQFCATTIHFSVTDWVRGGGLGSVTGYTPAPGYTGASGIVTGYVQLRAGAWWMRSLAQALCVTPTSDPLHAEFKAAVQNTVNFHHARYVAQANNPYGFVQPDVDYHTPNVFMSSPWMQDFFTAAFGYARAMGLPLDAAVAARLGEFFAWTARSVIGRLGSSSSTEWWYINAAPYTIAVAPSDTPDWITGTGPWYPNWRAMYDATFAVAPPDLGRTEGVLAGQDFPEGTNPSTWNNLQPALAYAVRFGVSGAQTAYNRMTGASNWNALLGVWSSKPVWAVMPAPGATSNVLTVAPPPPAPAPAAAPLPPIAPQPALIRPAWVASKAVHEWFAIPGSVHAGSAAAPNDDPADPYCNSTRRLAYSGISRKDAQIILAATGGHNDYGGNQVTGIDLAVDAPAWRLVHPGSPTDKIVPDVAYYRDGLPIARHTYAQNIFSTTRNRLMLHYTRFSYGSALSFGATNGFNLDTNQWDAAGTWSDGKPASGRDERDWVWAPTNYYRLNKWDPQTDTWSQTGSFANPIYGPIAHDTNRDQLFTLAWGDGWGSGTGIAACRYDARGAVQTPITFANNAAVQQFQADAPSYASMIYDSNGDRFLFWDGISRRLYQVTPNTGTAWAMSIVSVTGSLPPAASYSHSRLAYLPALRGCVFMPSGHEPLYFIRLA